MSSNGFFNPYPPSKGNGNLLKYTILAEGIFCAIIKIAKAVKKDKTADAFEKLREINGTLKDCFEQNVNCCDKIKRY